MPRPEKSIQTRAVHEHDCGASQDENCDAIPPLDVLISYVVMDHGRGTRRRPSTVSRHGMHIIQTRRPQRRSRQADAAICPSETRTPATATSPRGGRCAVPSPPLDPPAPTIDKRNAIPHHAHTPRRGPPASSAAEHSRASVSAARAARAGRVAVGEGEANPRPFRDALALTPRG